MDLFVRVAQANEQEKSPLWKTEKLLDPQVTKCRTMTVLLIWFTS